MTGRASSVRVFGGAGGPPGRLHRRGLRRRWRAHVPASCLGTRAHLGGPPSWLGGPASLRLPFGPSAAAVEDAASSGRGRGRCFRRGWSAGADEMAAGGRGAAGACVVPFRGWGTDPEEPGRVGSALSFPCVRPPHTRGSRHDAFVRPPQSRRPARAGSFAGGTIEELGRRGRSLLLSFAAYGASRRHFAAIPASGESSGVAADACASASSAAASLSSTVAASPAA